MQICVVVLFSAIWYLLGGYINGSQHLLPSSWTWKILRDWMTGFPWIPAIYTGIFSTGLCLWVEVKSSFLPHLVGVYCYFLFIFK